MTETASLMVGLVLAIVTLTVRIKSEDISAAEIAKATEASVEITTEITTLPEPTTQCETVIETEPQTETETEPIYESLGIFKITAYCSCSKCCGQWANNRPNGVVYGASGQQLISNYSIAVDTSIITYGEIVYINGREYAAHDCGGAIKGNRIDLYMNSHEAALQWGVREIEVFVKR